MLLTITSAGRVLSLFTTGQPEHGVTEVALALGVSKSKAHALLASLSGVGLLRRTDRGRYRLGWRVLSLTGVLNETTDFYRHARPVMQTLASRFGGVAELAVLEDDQLVYVDRTNGVAGARVPLGERLDACASAAGRVLLGHRPPSMLDAGDQPVPVPARVALDDALATARRLGFAVEHGEVTPGISCLAAPILAPGPVPVAAISLAVPSDRGRAHEQAYAKAIVRAGRYVTQRLLEADVSSQVTDRSVALA